MSEREEFAEFIRLLGRGPTLSRSLTRSEAARAMKLLISGSVAPVQVGAFLMLLRSRGETADELAGFIEAARAELPQNLLAAELDWPSYADKHRALPLFLPAALALAESGVRVVMHGIAGHALAGLGTRAALARLGVPVCASAGEAAAQLERSNFAYIGLETIAPELDRLLALRPLLGLRSPVNSLVRALNPFAAPYQLQGVFHPNFRRLHQEAAALLGQPHAAVFKGGGGEAQRNPEKPCTVAFVSVGRCWEEEWPKLHEGEAPRPIADDTGRQAIDAIWSGELIDAGAVRSITGTMALALRLLGRADDTRSAAQLAEDLWRDRSKKRAR